MKHIRVLLCLLLAACSQAPEHQQLMHGRFSAITLYAGPTSPAAPILLLADSTAEASVIDAVAAGARSLGTALFVIDTLQLQKDFADDIANCRNLGGDFDNMARYLEAYLQLPGFVPPVLLTTTASAALATAVLTPLPSQVFSGQAQLDNEAAAVSAPACARQTTTTHIAFDNSFADSLGTFHHDIQQQLPELPSLDPNVAMLPLNELPASGDGDTFAILLSGDGGWAGFDRDLAAALQAKGIGVVGWDSLRYFWQPRTPAMLAADLDTVISHYREHWHKTHVLLLGFSQGGNVLPFTLDKLTADSRAVLAKIALISPERFAQFEFHLGNWLHASDEGLALAPVLDGYTASTPLYCLYGSDDANAVCPLLQGSGVRVQGYESGHHLNNVIDDIVALLQS